MKRYIDPKSLTDRKKRYILRSASKYNAKLIIDVLGQKDGYFKVTISVDGQKSFFDEIKKHHIKTKKKPIPALISRTVFAELQVDPLGDITIGKNSMGLPVGVSLSQWIITSEENAALYIASKYPALWLDFRGSNTALFCGFEEFVGFPLKINESKIHDVAYAISKALRVPMESAISVLISREVLGDEEIELTIPAPLQNLFNWKLIEPEERPSSKVYLDLSGLPRAYYCVAMSIAEALWDDIIIIEIPKLSNLELFNIKNKAKKVVLTKVLDANIEGTFILKSEIIWNIRFKDSIISYSENYSALWENKDGE